MRIGVASLVDLAALSDHLDDWDGLQGTWGFPYISELVQEFLRRGHQVHVFALNDGINRPREYGGASLRVDVAPMRPRGADRVRDVYRLERRGLAEAIRESDVDVVHAHWTYEFGAAAVASGRPNLVTAHHSPWATVADARLLKPQLQGVTRYTDAIKNAGRETVCAGLAEWVVRKADHVTAVAPNVQSHLSRLMFPKQPVELIPNGLRPDPNAVPRSLRNAECPVFSFIGNGFGARKNSATALQAFALIRNHLPGARLILMGVEHQVDGPGHRWARSQGLDHGCDWLGDVSNEQVRTVLREETDVLVHTSRWEACSIAIMEAQSVGVPVIGGESSGGVPFSLQYGGAGLLVDVSRAEAVAEAMQALVSTPERYTSLSAGGLAAIESTFNLDHVVDAYEAALERVVRQRAMR